MFAKLVPSANSLSLPLNLDRLWFFHRRQLAQEGDEESLFLQSWNDCW